MPDISVGYILEMGQFIIQKVQGIFPWILSSLRLAIYWILVFPGMSQNLEKTPVLLTSGKEHQVQFYHTWWYQNIFYLALELVKIHFQKSSFK